MGGVGGPVRGPWEPGSAAAKATQATTHEEEPADLSVSDEGRPQGPQKFQAKTSRAQVP